MKVNFIELTNFRGIQKQRITFENKNFVALQADMWYHSSCQDFDPTFQEVPPCSDIPTARRFYGIS